jgi:hypothetical protein
MALQLPAAPQELSAAGSTLLFDPTTCAAGGPAASDGSQHHQAAGPASGGHLPPGVGAPSAASCMARVMIFAI